jgi:tetratricopeptide (TPR) repeat protein
VWAREQVRGWGLAAEPSLQALKDQERQRDPTLRAAANEARQKWLEALAGELADRALRPFKARRAGGRGWPRAQLPSFRITDEMLDRWLAKHPEHPDLLELRIRRQLGEQPEIHETARTWLSAYARARPVDPLPDRLLATAMHASAAPQEALPHLSRLDALEERDPAYALEIAAILRQLGDLKGAMRSIEKATRIDGYDPSTRELAAAIAIETGALDQALRHVRALQRLEPDRAVHAERARRIEARMEPPSATVPK